MREYKKPEIQIVSLKSSEDIALNFDAIRDQAIAGYLKDGNSNRYAITRYTVNNSVYNAASPAPAEG